MPASNVASTRLVSSSLRALTDFSPSNSSSGTTFAIGLYKKLLQIIQHSIPESSDQMQIYNALADELDRVFDMNSYHNELVLQDALVVTTTDESYLLLRKHLGKYGHDANAIDKAINTFKLLDIDNLDLEVITKEADEYFKYSGELFEIISWALLEINLNVYSDSEIMAIASNADYREFAHSLLVHAHLSGMQHFVRMIQACSLKQELPDDQLRSNYINTLPEHVSQNILLIDNSGDTFSLTEVVTSDDFHDQHTHNIIVSYCDNTLFLHAQGEFATIVYDPMINAATEQLFSLCATAPYIHIEDGKGLKSLHLSTSHISFGLYCSINPEQRSHIYAKEITISRDDTTNADANSISTINLDNIRIEAYELNFNNSTIKSTYQLSLHNSSLSIANILCAENNSVFLNGTDSLFTVNKILRSEKNSSLYFNKLNIEIRNAELMGDTLFESCKIHLSGTRFVSLGNLKFVVTADKPLNHLQIDAGVQLHSVKDLTLNCVIESKGAQILTDGVFTLDEAAQINGTALSVMAASANIRGAINLNANLAIVAKKHIYLARNSQVDCGNVLLDSDWITLVGRLYVRENASAVSLVFLQYPLSTFTASTKTIHTFLYFNFLGLSRAFNLDIKAVLDINCGLHAPACFNSISDVLTPARFGDLLLSLLKQSNRPLGMAMSLASKAYAPGMQLLESSQSSPGFAKLDIKNAMKILEQIKIISKNTEYRYTLRFVMNAYQTSKSSYAAAEELRSLSRGINIAGLSSFASFNALQSDAVLNIATQPLMMLIPKETHLAGLTVSGISVNGNIDRENLIDVTYTDVAYTKTIKTKQGFNYHTRAHTLTVTADDYTNLRGSTTQVNNLVLHADNLKNQKDSRLQANNTNIQVKRYREDGISKLANGQIKAQQSIHIGKEGALDTKSIHLRAKVFTSDGQSTLTDNSSLIAETVDVNDSMRVDKSIVVAKDKLKVGVTGNLNTTDANMIAPEAEILGKGTLNGGALRTGELGVAGHLKANTATVTSTISIKVEKDGLVDAKGSHLKTEAFTSDGQSTLTDNSSLIAETVDANDSMRVDKSIVVAKDKLKVGVTGNLNATDAIMIAPEAEILGKGTLNGGALRTGELGVEGIFSIKYGTNADLGDVNITKGAQLFNDKADMTTNTIVNHGYLSVNADKCKNNNSVENYGDIVAEGVEWDAGNVFINHENGEVKGGVASIKANKFSNAALIAYRNTLKITSVDLYNSSEIRANLLDITGDKRLDHRGVFKGLDIILNANWLNQYRSETRATGSLTMRSLLHTSVFSKNSAPNITSNSGVSFSFGSRNIYHTNRESVFFNFPLFSTYEPTAMPQSWSSFFSEQKIFNYGLSMAQGSGFSDPVFLMRLPQKAYTFYSNLNSIRAGIQPFVNGDFENARLRNLIGPIWDAKEIYDTCVAFKAEAGRDSIVHERQMPSLGSVARDALPFLLPSRTKQGIFEAGWSLNGPGNNTSNVLYSVTKDYSLDFLGASSYSGRMRYDWGNRLSVSHNIDYKIADHAHNGCHVSFGSNITGQDLVNNGSQYHRGSRLSYRNYISRGTDHLDDSSLTADTVKFSSNAHLFDASVHAEDLQISGAKVTYAGNNVIVAENYSEDSKARLEAITDSAHWMLEAKNANFDGTHNAANISLHVANNTEQQNNDLLNARGQGANLIASGMFALKSNTALTHHNNERPNVSMTATHIYFTGDIEHENLHVKTTEGGIRIAHKVKIANNLYLDSAQDIEISHEVKQRIVTQNVFAPARGHSALHKHIKIRNLNTKRQVTVDDPELLIIEVGGNFTAIAQKGYKQIAVNINVGKIAHIKAEDVNISRDLRAQSTDSGITAAQIYAHATKGNIIIDGKLQSAKFTYLEAAKGLILNCAIHQPNGSAKPRLIPTQLLSGAGLSSDEVGVELAGTGLMIKAKFIEMTGTEIESEGNNTLIAEDHIKIRGEDVSYAAVDATRKGFAWQEAVHANDVATQASKIRSKNGKNTILCTKGTIYWDGTHILAPKDTTIKAFGDIIGQPHIYKKILRIETRRAFGLLRKKRTEVTEQEIVSMIATLSDTIRLHSVTGRVDVVGTDFIIETETALLDLQAKEGIRVARTVLSHMVSEVNRSFKFGCDAEKMMKRPVSTATHGVSDNVQALARSQNGVEVGVNALNTLTNVTNAAKLAQSGKYGKSIIEQTGRVTATMSTTRTEQHLQTIGAGSIIGEGGVQATSDKAVELRVPIFVKDLTVNAPELVLGGTKLAASSKQGTNSVTVGFNVLTRKVDVGIAASKGSSSSTYYENTPMAIGKLNLNKVKIARVQNANVVVDEVTGEAEQLIVVSEQTKSNSKNSSIALDTNGNVSGALTKSEEVSAGQPSLLQINKSNAKFKRTEIHGNSQITAGDGHAMDKELNAERIEQHGYKKVNGASVSLNVATVLGIERNDKEKAHIVASVGVQHQNQQTITDANGTRITKDKHTDATLLVPQPGLFNRFTSSVSSLFAESNSVSNAQKANKDLLKTKEGVASPLAEESISKSKSVLFSPSKKAGSTEPKVFTKSSVDDVLGKSTAKSFAGAHHTTNKSKDYTSDYFDIGADSNEPAVGSHAWNMKSVDDFMRDPINRVVPESKGGPRISVGPKAHKVRAYIDKNGFKHNAEVDSGKFSKSAATKAKESFLKGERKTNAQVELHGTNKVLFDKIYNLIPGLPTLVQAQTYTNLQANTGGLNAKAMLYAAAATPVYSGERSGKFGKITAEVKGPTASFELGGQFAINSKGQVEEFVGIKSMIVAGITGATYTSPNMCVKDFCMQFEVALQAARGIGIEVAYGNVSHKAGGIKTSSTTRKVALGRGLMLGGKTKVNTSMPSTKYDNEPMLPAPYDNPMRCEVGGTATEQVYLYREQFRKNTLQLLKQAAEAKSVNKNLEPKF